MTNINNFKEFVRKKPELVSHIKNGNMTWQKFYEIYDMYGEEKTIWKEYLNNSKEEDRTTKKNNNTFENIVEMAKNLDTNKIQDGITSIQKAITLVGDMFAKEKKETASNYTPRPIYRRFDD